MVPRRNAATSGDGCQHAIADVQAQCHTSRQVTQTEVSRAASRALSSSAKASDVGLQLARASLGFPGGVGSAVAAVEDRKLTLGDVCCSGGPGTAAFLEGLHRVGMLQWRALCKQQSKKAASCGCSLYSRKHLQSNLDIANTSIMKFAPGTS